MDKFKEQWQASPLWQKILVITSFSLIIAYGIYMSYISPLGDKISELENQKPDLMQQLELTKKLADTKDAAILTKKIENLKNKLNQDKLKLEDFYKKIPTSPKIDEVIYFISNKAALNNLNLVSTGIEKDEEVIVSYDSSTDSIKIQPKEVQDDKDNKKDSKKQDKKDEKKQSEDNQNSITLKRISLVVSLTSKSYNFLEKFISDLYSTERLMLVRKISISKNKNNEIESQINIDTYYLPQEVNDVKTKK